MSESRETKPPAIGMQAPDFALADESGAERRLSELCRARPVVVIFYRGHW